MSDDSMKNGRMRLWLALLCLTGIVIWNDPFPSTSAVASAVSLPIRVEQTDIKGAAPIAINENVNEFAEATPRQATSVADAFGVKTGDWLPKPPASISVVKVAQASVAPVVLAPAVATLTAPPPPQPPALKVIGTWSGLEQPGIFLSGPNGTVFAKQGDKLLSDFEVKSIEPRELVLLQLSNQHEWRLPLPVITP